jgi:Transposase DDE domain
VKKLLILNGCKTNAGGDAVRAQDKESAMMLWGIPADVKRFFQPVLGSASKPVARALPAMVLAFLLAPHRRSLKTIAGTVTGHRVHAATVSRRLVNPHWKTHDWYVGLYERMWRQTDAWEGRIVPNQRRWMIVLDATYHGTMSECMENLILMSRRQDPRRRATRQHAFLMGMLLTDRGGRIPLPRRSYYTKEHCRRHGRRYRTLNDLATLMLKEVSVPEDVDVTVVFDSAFDADKIHRVCRQRGFREVFPIDPNRVLADSKDAQAAGLPGEKVVAWTRSWDREEFGLIELQVNNEDLVFFRRRHVDNLRVKKTRRRYAAAARPAAVSKLGTCLIVASYKENPKVQLLPNQSPDWQTYHVPETPSRKRGKKVPARWHGKVLACTDPTATARQVIEWYEVRWQVELFFREIKSRLQFGGYVLMKFEAVERYVDFLLMGFLFLEHRRLTDMKKAGPPSDRAGEPWVQARVTDRLRDLESLVHEWNLHRLEEALKTKAGRRRLLAELRQSPCRVA